MGCGKIAGMTEQQVSAVAVFSNDNSASNANNIHKLTEVAKDQQLIQDDAEVEKLINHLKL